MFLALKEMIYYKARYLLVIAIVFLIGYLMFFLTGLAVGLAQENRTAIDNWQADSVVLSEYANKNLILSNLSEDQYKDYLGNDKVAKLGQLSVVINQVSYDEKISGNIFALDWDSFIAPPIIKGRVPKTDNEVVMDKGLEVEGLNLGDSIRLNGSDTHYKIVGLTEKNSFFTTPLIYTDFKAFSKLKYGNEAVKNINALVFKNQKNIDQKGLIQLSINQLVDNIPGYQAQVKTFSFMIGSMVIITFLILGIFMYILTIQKLPLYGIMRAQGIQSKTLLTALFFQIFTLTSLGMLISLFLILVTQQVLPAKLPFYSDGRIYLGLTLAVVLMSLLGGLLSMGKILKLDPLEAIGGE